MHTSEGALTIATSSLMLLKSCPPTIRTASSIALLIATLIQIGSPTILLAFVVNCSEGKTLSL
jgi:hypothetical protein